MRKIKQLMRFNLLLLLLIPLMVSATNYSVSTEPELSNALSKAKAGDVIQIAEGDFIASRIYAMRESGTEVNPIIIRGAGIRKTVISGKNGKGIRLFGDYYILEHLTLTGGGDPLEIAGDHNIIRWISAEESNIGIKISGNDNLVEDCFIYSNEKTGIEINGGYIYRPEWGQEFTIRIRKAIGQVPSFTPQQNAAERLKWSAEQLAEMEFLWGHRNMNNVLRRIFLHDNGYNRYENQGLEKGWKFGQAMYGGGIKCVPNVGGLVIDSVFVYKNGFSGLWFDEPASPSNYIQNSVVIQAQHGAHYEIGLHPEAHHAYIRNNVFWHVHQGFFNSASAENYFENNTICAGQYGAVNHGIKGERLDRITVSHFKNNHIYLDDFDYPRIVGEDNYLNPIGHVVWFSGPNSIGSSRSGNVYYTTDEFPELKISNTNSEGYSFSPQNLGMIGASESQRHISEVPDLVLPTWPLRLPLFQEYFDYPGVVFEGDTTIIVNPPDSVIVNPPNPTSRKTELIWINDYADTRVDPDGECTSAFLNLVGHKYFNITEVVGGHKWSLPNALNYFNQKIGSAYTQERDALESAFGGFPESLDVHLASTNGKGFISNLTKEQLENDPQYATLKYLRDRIAAVQKIYIASGGTMSEASTLANYLLKYEPQLISKVIFISHGVLPGLHNYDRDKDAALFMINAAASGQLSYIRTGRSGMNFIDDRTFPKMDEAVLESLIGNNFLGKWLNNKPDFSDGIMLVLFLEEMGGGESVVMSINIKKDGTNNGPYIEALFNGKKYILYNIIETHASAATSGVIIDPCPDCGENPDPDPTTPTAAEVKAFLINIANTILDFSTKF